MFLFDLTLATPEENLACDEALLEACEAGSVKEVLRFWEPEEHFVVVGYANRVATEVNVPFCEENGISILRRCTGGGTVLQGPGCLNYSLLLRIGERGARQTITGTNRFVLHRHQGALSGLLNAAVELKGHTDLAIGGLKFSGNAQRRRRDYLLFHGSFLLGADMARIEQALKMPSRQPDYRANRAHRDFLVNLGVASAVIKSALAKVWSATEPLEDFPMERIGSLARTKYGTREWNYRF